MIAKANHRKFLKTVSMKILENEEYEQWISTIVLEYAVGEIETADDTNQHCVYSLIGGKLNGNYQLKKIYGLTETPTKMQNQKT